MARRQPHADKAAHRQPRKVARRHPKMRDQLRRILAQRVHVIARVRHAALPLPAMVKGDASKSEIAEMVHLRGEHLAAPQQPVREHDRRAIPSGVRVVNSRSVQIRIGHSTTSLSNRVKVRPYHTQSQVLPSR